MKRLSIILIVGICTLSSALCRAESVAIPHHFQTMFMAGELTWTGSPTNYAIGYTDLVTYTCSNSGSFTLDGSSHFQITLPSGGIVQTSPAVENLTLLTLSHSYGSKPTWIKIYISTDNFTWTEIAATHMNKTIDAPMPVKGNYFIKIVNDSGATVSFQTFRWVYDPCHCLRVVSE
jgi:hypothetical protein